MSDKETPDSAVSGGVTRRDALVKAGVVAAGAVAAGSMAGTAKAAVRKKETFSDVEGEVRRPARSGRSSRIRSTSRRSARS